ncbi:MAG: hypothetical protein ACI4M5_02955 [Christensenellales bacterium]
MDKILSRIHEELKKYGVLKTYKTLTYTSYEEYMYDGELWRVTFKTDVNGMKYIWKITAPER